MPRAGLRDGRVILGDSSFERARALPGRRELSLTARKLEGADAEEILRWALRTYVGGIALSVSFGGAEGLVLLDMLLRMSAKGRVFTIDTGFLFEETIAFRDKIARSCGLRLQVVRPTLTVDEQNGRYGDRLYSSNPDLCCYLGIDSVARTPEH